MHPGSRFDRSLVKLKGGWPSNAFTGEPMRIGNRLGDFSYLVHGATWRLLGHLSDHQTVTETANHIC